MPVLILWAVPAVVLVVAALGYFLIYMHTTARVSDPSDDPSGSFFPDNRRWLTADKKGPRDGALLSVNSRPI